MNSFRRVRIPRPAAGKLIALTLGLCALAPGSATAQLRVVTYNTIQGPHPGMGTVLEALGEEQVGGIAKPIDVLLLQEQTGVSASTQEFVEVLDDIYGAGTYSRSQLNGGPSFSDIRQTLVYNNQTVQLLGETRLGDTGSPDQARQTLRYHLRPTGYDEAADFYAYNSHYLAGDAHDSSGGTTVGARRNSEANVIRTDADSLGPGTHAIYAGDFNMNSSNEQAFQTLLADGPGQAFDPAEQLGTWGNNFSFREWHTQSPCASGCPSGFVSGGMDDRFDFQLVTGEFQDGEGLSYLEGSYRTFGNNGTTYNQSVTSNANTYAFDGVISFSSADVRSALFTASDHLPVVADYQLPAVLEAFAGAVPSSVLQDEIFNVEVTVRNAAEVVAAAGADELDYSLSTTGGLTGSASGSELALGVGTTHSVTLDTSSPGGKLGSILVSTDSQGTANRMVEIPISYEVLPSDNSDLLVQESFESPPGDGYLLSEEIDDGGFDYFGRFPAPDPTNVHRDDFSNFHGNFAIYGEDHDSEGPATTTIEIPGIEIEGHASFEVVGLFGAVGDGEGEFEVSDGDGIELWATTDGGAPEKVGGFAPDHSGVSDLFLDADLDGIGEGVEGLSTVLSEFAFPFTASGDVLDLTIALTSTASQEHLAVDNIRLVARGVPGDYNGDGIVNAADYIVWRNHLGTEFVLANEAPEANTPGIVDQEDYDFWVSRFGESSAAGSGTAVPEPASLALLVAVGLGMLQRRA